MEFDPADLARDTIDQDATDRANPVADLARFAGRWILIPLAAIAAGLALVEALAARTGRKSPRKGAKAQRKE